MATTPSSARKRAGKSGLNAAVEYPDSDGKPVGETGIHVDLLFEILGVLRSHFEGRQNVAILANMFLYYKEGNNKKSVAPDIFVTFDVPANTRRRTFKVWEEGKSPDCVIELTSKGTRDEDRRTKFRIYQDILKVREYFLFDPEQDYLNPSLQGYRLAAGRYEPIAWKSGRLPSEVLGLHLERDGLDLRLYDPRTGRWLPNRREVDESLREEELARREQELARREQELARLKAEAENERLRKEIEELRKKLNGNS